MKLNSQCILCLLKRHEETALKHGDQEQATAFIRDLMRLLSEGPADMSAPFYTPAIAKLFSEHPKVVSIDAYGPCEVTAADIKIDDEVEIVNPELHIATLSEGAHLQMQITLEKGRGYVSAEKNKNGLR